MAASAALSLGAVVWSGCVDTRHQPARRSASVGGPWYRRTLRWGQTNITEADAADYDIGWWRNYWKHTRVQGLIINAGGIVAYYPTQYPLQYRPSSLGERDLFGELIRAAREEGLVVLARMDSSRAHENLYQAHPDWFALDSLGRPHKAGDLFVTCVNGPYYTEYLPGILREIISRYHPEGFTDNSWSGLGRQEICYCENCRKKFRERIGQELPEHKNWDDPIYGEWLEWNYARRLELWDENNRVTREAGGPDCLWIGMNSGSIAGQCQSFRDYRKICQRAEMILLDHQARGESGGFSQNAEVGQLIHGLLGWDKLIPESMAMYQAGRPTFRKSSRPETEARLWMLEGLAGGLQPWWHHVGAQQEDRRQFLIAEPIYRWHQANQQYLVDREPVASVGLLWSQRNYDFFGRDQATERLELPWRGWTRALVRARIPYLPVNAEDLTTQAKKMPVLILPNFGALSEAEADALRAFVKGGGALIATGRTGLYDERGRPRADFLLADLLGAHYLGLGREGKPPRELGTETLHSYLRIEQAFSRHKTMSGFENTEILPFGGWLGDVIPAEGGEVPLTYVPSFPVYPPETSWMREPRTKIPGLILNQNPQSGRTAFLVADMDRRFAVDQLPDQGRLLANLVRWAAGDRLGFALEGPGLIDCRLYRQNDTLILHLVNLSTTGTSAGAVDEVIPIGPLKITVALPADRPKRQVRSLVGRVKPSLSLKGNQATVILPTLVEYDVLVLG